MAREPEEQPESPPPNEPPPPDRPDEGFETQHEIANDEPGKDEGFDTDHDVRAPRQHGTEERQGEGFEIERQT